MTASSLLTVDHDARHVSLDARDPAFYRDPNQVYAALHAMAPTFYWKEQRQWYFTGYDHVNALLRDRRFGRQTGCKAGGEDEGHGAEAPRRPGLAVLKIPSMVPNNRSEVAIQRITSFGNHLV